MRFPTIPFEERVRLYEGLDGVDRVVVQDDMLYDDILAELKPDYVIHGDNWRTGPEAALRESAIRALAQYGGELIEAPYTVNEEVRKIDLRLKEKLAMPEFPGARRRLRQLVEMCPIVKTIEAHNGLTGLIAEKTVVETGRQAGSV